mmetsp:Transcript_16776/g.41296  ORF Transcript_16776/g.41296 Transcript_16776/m.41296 type:complete len:477 (-) Transcript_16776:552-1982(-)|eukprot:CAMPEP_0114496116 /NCGR_PEP_ID=MMETSP0109-20121206/5595_1 /TAXON_ID=29199 /ORGANISM="Chlorarachnion reptans, Strain CCCM449" /LENGTH=476 /DNA_ID=CAMNT_0001673361 /DNA_START=254 /DNA_END=1684 /DNA_ORIENTATION=+
MIGIVCTALLFLLLDHFHHRRRQHRHSTQNPIFCSPGGHLPRSAAPSLQLHRLRFRGGEFHGTSQARPNLSDLTRSDEFSEDGIPDCTFPCDEDGVPINAKHTADGIIWSRAFFESNKSNADSSEDQDPEEEQAQGYAEKVSFNVTTHAGAPKSKGYSDGIGSEAKFFTPMGISADEFGYLLVADKINSAIRRISPNGDVSTEIAHRCKDGKGQRLKLRGPIDIHVAGQGVMFFVECESQGIRVARSQNMLPCKEEILVNKVKRVNRKDEHGRYPDLKFRDPRSVCVTPEGDLLVADLGREKLKRVTPAGEIFAVKMAGIQYAAVDKKGNIFATDTAVVWTRSTHTITKIGTDGVPSTYAGTGYPGYKDGRASVAMFKDPVGIAVDPITDDLLVADRSNRVIRRITPDSFVTTIAGTASEGIRDGLGKVCRFFDPAYIAKDSYGSIYVSEPAANIIRKLVQVVPKSDDKLSRRENQ